jgi:hypothetical protein
VSLLCGMGAPHTWTRCRRVSLKGGLTRHSLAIERLLELLDAAAEAEQFAQRTASSSR